VEHLPLAQVAVAQEPLVGILNFLVAVMAVLAVLE
tara:strand:+ start:81 stop:185 length:105 start_codon:yes stop_codon:yes gene_type:complete